MYEMARGGNSGLTVKARPDVEETDFMSLPLNRRLAVLLVSAILAGCQGLSVQQKNSLTEKELFAKGLDQYSATGDLQMLQRLPQTYPDGPWAHRAAAVVKLVEQEEQCIADKEAESNARAVAQKQQMLLKNKELDRCHNEMVSLRQNNQELEETIARLKKLLIEMELRSN